MVVALLLPGAAPPPAGAQPVVAPAVAQQDAEKDKSVKVDKITTAAVPDAALLDYLGSYGDAADGLDPLGLAEADDAPAHKPQAQEHQ